MTLDDIPYPHLINTDQPNIESAMLQCYYATRSVYAFNILQCTPSSPKTVIIATQAVDNIMYIGLNYCKDVSSEQVDHTLNAVKSQQLVIDTIETDMLPVILPRSVMGTMKINVNQHQLIYWNEYINKYSHAFRNR